MDFNRNLRIVRTQDASYPFPYRNDVLWVHHDRNNNPVAEIWDHGKWVPFTGDGSSSVDLSDYYTKKETNTKLGEYALKDSVKQPDWNTSDSTDSSFIKNKPTKLSQFENDGGFLTEHQKLKTINGNSIEGEGDIEIPYGSQIIVDSELDDTSENPVQNKAITSALAELQDYCFPTSLEATVSPSSMEWTGDSVEVSVGYKVLRNSKAVTADTVTINFNGETKTLENTNGGSEKFIVTSLGYKSGSVSAKKGSTVIKNSPRSISVNLYLPVYYGFSKATGKDDIVITELIKGGSSISGARTLNNDDATKYLWLCVPYSMSVNKVTSSGFDVPFLAPVEANTTLGSYKCYRTQDLPGSGDMTIVIS